MIEVYSPMNQGAFLSAHGIGAMPSSYRYGKSQLSEKAYRQSLLCDQSIA
jgi:hypothetical protein